MQGAGNRTCFPIAKDCATELPGAREGAWCQVETDMSGMLIVSDSRRHVMVDGVSQASLGPETDKMRLQTPVQQYQRLGRS